MRVSFLATAVLALAAGEGRSQAGLPVETHVAGQAPADPSAPFVARRLSNRSTPADGKTLAIGASRYSFTSGRLWEVVAQGGRPVGFYFTGKGMFTFTADEPAAGRVFARNARNVGGVDRDESSLKAPFKRASFVASPALFPEWALEEGETGPAEELGTHLARWKDDRAPRVEPSLAAAGATGRYFASFIEASSDLRHVYDDVTDDMEDLAVVKRPPGLPLDFPAMRIARTIASRPIGRSRRAAPRVDVKLLAVDVDVREADGVWGLLRVEETYRAERDVASIALDFATEAIVSSTLLKTRILSVTDGAGNGLAYSAEQGRLVVTLPKPAAPGSAIVLRLVYGAPYLARAGGDNCWELPIESDWYPRPHNRNGSSHTFHAVVRTRKPFLAIPTGETVRRGEEGEWNVVETRLDRPVPFATIVAGKYTLQESTEDGVTGRVASYGISKEMSGKQLLAIFHATRKFLTWLLGPFPWKEYTIIEINRYGFGQAPPGMMRITKEAFLSNVRHDQLSSLFSRGINQRFAHEIAHSYFGYVVSDASPNHQWISESFSEVCSGFALEKMKDPSEGGRLVAAWKSDAKDATDSAPIFLANDLAATIASTLDESTSRDRAGLVYAKGAFLLHTLRGELGDNTFFTVLRTFLRSFEKKQTVTTDDFADVLFFVTKKDWKPWLEKTYYGYEMP